jgi:anaerobic magnesium-protoporphyrin IX monomethyl ester cyclase
LFFPLTGAVITKSFLTFVLMKVLLFNPRSADYKYRVPMSVLQVAGSIEGKYDWAIVDGNRENDPWHKLAGYLDTGEVQYVGFTVMPGPQLKQAIPFAQKIKAKISAH